MKKCLMVLYGPLESDARVLRTLSVFRKMQIPVELVSCNTKAGFQLDGVELSDIPIKVGIKGFLKFTAFSLLLYLKRKNEVGLVYLNDYFSVVPGLLVSYMKRKGMTIIYDAHELILSCNKYPQSRKLQFFCWVEKRLAKRVNITVEANKERMDLFRKQYGLENVSYVMNISNVKYAPQERTAQDGTFKIVYQGVMAKKRRLDFFLDGLKNLPENIRLMYIGDGDGLPELKEKAKDMGLEDRVEFVGRVANAEMMKMLATCHVGIISYPLSDYNNIYCSPNKIFEYSAMAMPFISTNQPFICEVQDKYQIGRTFKFMDVVSFTEELMKIYNHYNSYLQGFERFLSDYSYEGEMRRLEEIIANTIGK